MKRQIWWIAPVTLVTLLFLAFVFAPVAAAEPVLRFVSVKSLGPREQLEIRELSKAANELYESAPGCRWVVFWSNPVTLEDGTVSYWESQKQMEEFAISNRYLELTQDRVRPLVEEGRISVRVQPVHVMDEGKAAAQQEAPAGRTGP